MSDDLVNDRSGRTVATPVGVSWKPREKADVVSFRNYNDGDLGGYLEIRASSCKSQ